MQHTNTWFPFVQPNPDPSVRLFCFHYAGGRALVFRDWKNLLPSWIQVIPVELPGRGARIQEPLFRSLDAAVEALHAVVRPHLDLPFAFFGHSMGALISFELARALRRSGDPLPWQLFLSAHRAPHLPNPSEPIYGLSQAAFIEKILDMNGTPPEVLAYPELLNLVVPILRADFEVCDTYAYTPAPPLDCPITVFGGETDHVVPPALLPAWSEHTSDVFNLHTYPGDHFFLQHVQSDVLSIMSRDLAQVTR